MALVTNSRRRALWQVAALAFLVAGLGALGNEVLYQVGSAEAFRDLGLLITYGGVTLGLVGIHTRLVEASPRLSLVGLVTVGITALSIAVAVVAKSVIGAEPSGWEVSLSIVVSASFYLCSTLCFLIFGVACVRTRVPSRAIGYLLLLAVPARGLVLAGQTEVASALFAVSMMGAGYLLWTGRSSTTSERPRPSPTSR